MEKVIFQSTDRGATKVFDEIPNPNGEPLLHFCRRDLNLVMVGGHLTRTDSSDVWICILTDPELIERAKKHKDFSKVPDLPGKFWIVEEDPSIKGVNPLSITRKFTQDEKSVSPEKAIRYGELKATLFKKNGEVTANATEEDLAEFQTLKTELGV